MVVFGVALALRLFIFNYISRTPFKFYTFDSIDYDQRALTMLRDHVFSAQTHPPFSPDLVRTPGYPALLAAVYAVVGHQPAIVILLQLLIGSTTAVLTFSLARALGLPGLPSVVAGLVVATDPVSVMTSNVLLTETLFTALLVAGLLALTRYWHTLLMRWLVVSALALGLMALTRPIGQFLPLLLIPLLILSIRHLKRRNIVTSVALFALLSLSLTYSWAYRNDRETGVLTLSTITDTNLIYYRAREVLADATHTSQDDAWNLLQSRITALAVKRHLDENGTLMLERQQAFAIFAHYPLLTALMMAKGAGRLVIDPGYSIVCTLLNLHTTSYHCFPGSQANMDEPNATGKALNGLKQMTSLQRGVLLWSAILLTFAYLAGIVGAMALTVRNRWMALALPTVVTIYFVALSAGAETTSRFRVAVIPFVAILAGEGVAVLVQRLSYRRFM